MILDRRYKDWNRQSYPKRMWLLKEIYTNSNKNFKVSLGKISMKIAPMRTIMKWVDDWVSQGYMELSLKSNKSDKCNGNNRNKNNRFCEYKLTNKGEEYLNKYYKCEYTNYEYTEGRGNMKGIGNTKDIGGFNET